MDTSKGDRSGTPEVSDSEATGRPDNEPETEDDKQDETVHETVHETEDNTTEKAATDDADEEKANEDAGEAFNNAQVEGDETEGVFEGKEDAEEAEDDNEENQEENTANIEDDNEVSEAEATTYGVDDDDQKASEENEKQTEEDDQFVTEQSEYEKETITEEDDQFVTEQSEYETGTNTEEDGVPELTEEERIRCVHVFDMKAANGRLDLKGFKTVLRALGQILSSDQAERMFEDGEPDDDNTIDVEEFCRLYSKHREEEDARKQAILESVDKLFLCASEEFVELKKVQQLLLKLQQPDLGVRLAREKSDLGEEDVRRLVKSLDKHGSGLVSKPDFVDILCQHLDI